MIHIFIYPINFPAKSLFIFLIFISPITKGQYTFEDFHKTDRVKELDIKLASPTDSVRGLLYSDGTLMGTAYLKTVLSYYFDLPGNRIIYQNLENDIAITVEATNVENHKQVIPTILSELFQFNIKDSVDFTECLKFSISKNSQLETCTMFQMYPEDSDESYDLCFPISWIVRFLGEETGELITYDSYSHPGLYRFTLPLEEGIVDIEYYRNWFKEKHDIDVKHGLFSVNYKVIEFIKN